MRFSPLTGGVSSDIVRVDLPDGPICFKRALPKLKVQADWQAPVERNRWEVEWMRVAALHCAACRAACARRDDGDRHVRDGISRPVRHPVWKSQLARRRHSDRWRLRRKSARASRRIHAHTAHRGDLAEQFATDHIFFPIRLEPYLAATARAHPDCAAAPAHASDRHHRRTKNALVHGDVSPKNILVGPSGPVFLDAECAWYGDPGVRPGVLPESPAAQMRVAPAMDGATTWIASTRCAELSAQA